jgi:hypothetical protein
MSDEKVLFENDIVKIKLYNKNNEYVAETIISKEDYLKVNTLKLYAKIDNCTTYVYNKKIPLHHLIIGKPINVNDVVDHIDHNGLNNTRENLRIVNRSINAHNKTKKKDSTSEYIGVSYGKSIKKWKSYIRFNNKQAHLGTFENEIDAAISYDKYAYQIYKEFANTNNLLTIEEKKNAINTEFIINERELPKYINYYKKNNNYCIRVTFNKKRQQVYTKTLEEAKVELNKLLELKKQYEEEQVKYKMNIDILRDRNNIPIIIIKKHYNLFICYVDGDIWHHLNIINWNIHNGYAIAMINNIPISMHSYIYKLKYNEENSLTKPIDHINNNKLDNRINNLRITTISNNNQNKQKKEGCISKYTGVYFNKKNNKWYSQIIKNYKTYYLGSYNIENDAAIAYNNKALELYGCNAKLNKI